MARAQGSWRGVRASGASGRRRSASFSRRTLQRRGADPWKVLAPRGRVESRRHRRCPGFAKVADDGPACPLGVRRVNGRPFPPPRTARPAYRAGRAASWGAADGKHRRSAAPPRDFANGDSRRRRTLGLTRPWLEDCQRWAAHASRTESHRGARPRRRSGVEARASASRARRRRISTAFAFGFPPRARREAPAPSAAMLGARGASSS